MAVFIKMYFFLFTEVLSAHCLKKLNYYIHSVVSLPHSLILRYYTILVV